MNLLHNLLLQPSLHQVMLVGAIVGIAGYCILQIIASRHKSYAFLSLMLFLVGTQPLGFLLWGEPAGTAYLNGWLIGLFPCIIYGFWNMHRRPEK